MASSLTLEGRVVFVTGSTRGIGWATAQSLSQAGATVVLHGRSDDRRTRELAAQLSAASGQPAMGIVFDATDVAALKNAYKTIFREYGRLDALVNNAGVLQDGLLGMIPAEAINLTLQINTVAVIHNIQEASRLIARSGGGSIVNVSSIIGTNGNDGQVVYAASKAAVIGITKSAAKELASKRIRVNAVAPGFIDTDMVRQLPPAKFDERMRSIRMGRIGQPADVANAILYLVSDLSTYVTGQVIGVDGGMLI